MNNKDYLQTKKYLSLLNTYYIYPKENKKGMITDFCFMRMDKIYAYYKSTEIKNKEIKHNIPIFIEDFKNKTIKIVKFKEVSNEYFPYEDLKEILKEGKLMIS